MQSLDPFIIGVAMTYGTLQECSSFTFFVILSIRLERLLIINSTYLSWFIFPYQLQIEVTPYTRLQHAAKRFSTREVAIFQASSLLEAVTYIIAIQAAIFWLITLQDASLVNKFIIYKTFDTFYVIKIVNTNEMFDDLSKFIFLEGYLQMIRLYIFIIIMIYRKLFKFHSFQNLYSHSVNKKADPVNYTLFPIESYDLGQRLDRYLKNTDIGWISAQKYLRNQDIIVQKQDGTQIATNNYRFQSGDQLMIRNGKQIQQYLIGDKNIKYIQLDKDQVKTALDSMTIFDNPNITVLNKSAGYSVQGGPDPHYNLFSLMAARYKKDMIYISHRLDKPTTGLVFISKNVQTAKLLGQALQSRQGLSKFYLAMTQGNQVIDKKGTISCQLEWTSKHKARMVEALSKSQNTHLAVTKYLRLRQKQLSDILWRNLLGLQLVTGKKHQIRCHLSQYLLNPILNDELYLGRKTHPQLNSGIFLHSFAIKISNPQIIQKVFLLKSFQNKVILQNQKGTMKCQDQSLVFLGKLSKIWQPYSQTIIDSMLQTLLSDMESNFKQKHVIRSALRIE